MKTLRVILASVMMLTAFTACEKSLDVAGAAEGNSVLNIVTRSGESDAKVSYPVTVYVMNSDGQCVRKQQLLSATSELLLKLQPMTYHIYAIGGATDGDYSLPGQDDATATSEVTLNADAAHGDLMTAKNTVTMSEEENTTLTLSMNRRVMHLESLVVNNVPKSVSAVSMTLEPIYDNLLLDGTYSATAAAQTVTLTEQADGTTWQNAEELFMLPSADKATITVTFTHGTATKSYAYSCPLALEANKHIRITGTFTGTEELELTGVITGATWEGTTTIEFTFNEEGSTTTDSSTTDDSGDEPGGGSGGTTPAGNDDDAIDGPAPAVKSVYQECYVLSSTDDGDYALVTLVHKDEADISGTGKTEAQILEEIEAALPAFDTAEITGWRLPTTTEAAQFSGGLINNAFSNAQVDGTDINSDWYYCTNGDQLKLFVGATGVVSQTKAVTFGQHLRPVTTLKFRK